MFAQHCKEELSAYAHGELSPEETRRVAAHLDVCARCRREFEEIRFGIRLAESLPTQSAPAALWDNVEAALSNQDRQRRARRAHESSPRSRFGFNFNGGRAAVAVGFALLFVAVGTLAWLYVRPSRAVWLTRAAWEVARVEGAPRIDSNRIGATGQLAVGGWLETDAASRAQIKVADIGQVDVEPDTRIRLVQTRATEHRLELARGRMHARIYAPPRLFFVNTPSGVAADLGCAYTLEVDDRGGSLLHVTGGRVALGAKERESIVPAGAACATEPGAGTGTPFFEDASAKFRDALKRFDFEDGGAPALSRVLEEARRRDTLTLWHLLLRVGDAQRGRVYQRLAALSPPPDAVTREGVLRLERPMLDLWQQQLEDIWLEEPAGN